MSESRVMTVQDIMVELKLGRNLAYKLLNSNAFPVHRIGKKIYVSRKIFDDWLNYAGKYKIDA